MEIRSKIREIFSSELIIPRRNERNTRKSLYRKYYLNEWFYKERQVLTLYKNDTNKHIIYLHGGGYISEASILHIRMLKMLANKFKVTFIDYPLAPEYNYKDSNNYILEVYKLLCTKYPNDDFYLFGDSAGGGLALSLLEQVRDANLKRIQKSVLVSPWVDLSMTNHLIDNYAYDDLMLSLKNVKNAAYLYSNDDDVTNPLISPLYGKLDDIGNILLFVGTKEILYPDIMILYGKIKPNARLIKGIDKYHDWVMLPTKTNNSNIDAIIDFYNN